MIGTEAQKSTQPKLKILADGKISGNMSAGASLATTISVSDIDENGRSIDVSGHIGGPRAATHRRC